MNRDEGPSMRYLFIFLFCAACVESPGSPPGPSDTQTGGPKGKSDLPGEPPPPPARDPRPRVAPSQFSEVTIDGEPLAVERPLDDATTADVERCTIAAKADL